MIPVTKITKKLRLKDAIWEQIAKEFNLESGEAAKEQWKKVRDCHRDALKRQEKKKRGALPGASGIRPWVYQKKMEFLVPFMTNRSPGLVAAVADYTSDGDDKVEFLEEIEIEPDQTSLEEDEIESRPSSLPTPSKKSKTSGVNDLIVKTLKNLEKRAEARDSMRSAIADNLSSQKPVGKNDPLYNFFLCMYQSTRQLPLSNQLSVRRKIFEVVSKEEEIIMLSDSTAKQGT
ncbi:uncharacterized protein LOC111058511 isoform X2 [Nilaparvata lugens]|uniref:uncharacterized protein LOC111058511 isoform X2 n=1 Tax=Nilaparvata lugens TaxID=108931 RepID=UPI00193E2AA4|nr:uncharacterized protein LOC111058511 isoform X2 [Nilaparvata lugens]